MTGMRYAGFISYSHAADGGRNGGFAARLKRQLERFAQPWYRRSTIKVFRDESDLTADPDLWGSVVAAMDDSQHFILLASPASAQRAWVRREVAHWLATRGTDGLLIAVTAGSLSWHADGRLDRERTDCLPDEILDRVNECAWFDLRALRQSRARLFGFRARAALAGLAGLLHGVDPKRLLASESARIRRAMAGLAALTAVAMLATVLAAIEIVTAMQARDRAIEAQHVAADRRNTAVSRKLLAIADEVTDTDPRLAVRLALTARYLEPGSLPDAAVTLAVTSTPIAASLNRHSQVVWDVDFSPDGRLLATASEDQTIIIWDLDHPGGPQPLGVPLTGHTGPVFAVAFSPDGRMLASSSWDRQVILWDVADPRNPHRIGRPLTGHTDSTGTVAFSPDGRTLATGSADRTVLLWDISDSEHPRQIGAPLTGHTAAVRRVRFSPDGRILASASDDHSVILWSVPDHKPIGKPLVGHGDIVKAIAFHPNGRILASASYDRSLVLWDLADPNDPKVIDGYIDTGHNNAVRSVDYSPDGRTLATASFDGTVRLFDVSNLPEVKFLGRPLVAHTGYVLAARFSPDGKVLATAGADHTAVLWRLDEVDMKRLGTASSTAVPPIYNLAFRPDGRYLATIAEDHAVRLWDISSPADIRPAGGTDLRGKEIPEQYGYLFVEYSPDGRLLAASSQDGSIQLWDVVDPDRPVSIGPLTETGTVFSSAAFAPDGRTLVAGGLDDQENNTFVWDVSNPRQARLVHVLKAGGDFVTDVSFSPDGRLLATANRDSLATIWAIGQGEDAPAPMATLNAHNDSILAVAFSPDGQLLATAAQDSTVVLWDVSAPARPTEKARLTDHAGAVVALGFAATGSVLTTTGGKSVLVWDVSDPDHPVRIGLSARQAGEVTIGRLSPDERMLATASIEGRLSLWDITRVTARWESAQSVACTFAGGGLSQQEWASFVADLPYQRLC